MRRLTEAVYDGAARDRGEPVRRSQVRLLPGPATALALVAVLVLVVGASLWRSSRAPSGVVGGDLQSGTVATVASAPPSAGPSPSGPVPAGAGTPGSPVPQGTAGATVLVYVTGRVASPGVVEVPAGARVLDAVTAAGGSLADADLEALNLARVVVDGEHIVLWRPGEAPAGAGADGAGPAGSTGARTGSGGQAAGACVDLNTADQAALETLDGVGPALAGRILAHRQQVGRIDSADQLDDVPGIGPALVARIGAGTCQ